MMSHPCSNLLKLGKGLHHERVHHYLRRWLLHGDDYDINFDEMETSELIAFIQKNITKIRGKATAGSDLEKDLKE